MDFNNNRMIGIIGGMGPHSGLELCRELLNASTARTDQEHLPFVLSNQPAIIPDRASFVFDRNKPDPKIGIFPQIDSLSMMGVSVIGIPCVTAHAPSIMDDIVRYASHLGIECLNIVDETLKFISEAYPGVKKVAAISTQASYEFDLFNTPLRNSSFDFIDIGKEQNLSFVEKAIRDPKWGIKACSDPVSTNAKQCLLKAVEYLREKNTDAIILGCTELPLALPQEELHGIKLVNPMRALARALVKSVSPMSLKAI